eukprot:TRINITY_DN3429_c0_g1_i4.p1 TRINITY_DN3429_c0_g1~~TRINITY_DN3429_c0_g1_i4.p1  ORF type:complete len:398 (-),score=65.75 TRINITY_DN3429_c0_g1_i4:85-1191(-)
MGEIHRRRGERYDQLSKDSYNKAIAAFISALSAEYDFQTYLTPIKVTATKIISRSHFLQLNDKNLIEKYTQAISKAVKSFSQPPTVLNLKSGAGLHSLIAARSGADHIYAVENLTPLAQISQSIVEENGYQSKISVISQTHSELILGLNVPKRANLLINGAIDFSLLGEGILESGVYLRRASLLTDDAKFIPSAAKVYAQVIDSPLHFTDQIIENVSGFNFQNLNVFYTMNLAHRGIQLEDISYTEVTDVQEVLFFDFSSETITEINQNRVKFNVMRKGTFQNLVVAFWFKLYLDEEKSIVIDSGPKSRTYWGQAVEYLGNEWRGKEFEIHSDTLEILAKHNVNKIHFEFIDDNNTETDDLKSEDILQ